MLDILLTILSYADGKNNIQDIAEVKNHLVFKTLEVLDTCLKLKTFKIRMKYSIEKIFDLKKWDYLVDQSENSSIFFKSFFLIPLKEKIDYFIIKKNNKPISGFFLITDGKKNIVENDLIIHSGIFFIKEKNIKISSLNAQIHETIETFKNFIVQNYKKIKVSFLPEIQDIRSFQWHNYHNNKKKFKIDIKFTSFLNLKDFNPSNYLKSKLYLNLNEKTEKEIFKLQ